jgi:hypothetical protein
VTLSILGVDEASPLLEAALDGWAAFERECCLAWLRDGGAISRETLQDMLVRTFFAALEAVAQHDTQAAEVLARLQVGG